MAAPPTLHEGQLFGYPTGALVAEASDLGWPPGHFPEELTLVLSRGLRAMYRRAGSPQPEVVRYEPILPNEGWAELFPPIDILND